jgi:hypothetical protein
VLPYELWAVKLPGTAGDQLPMMSTTSPMTTGIAAAIAPVLPRLHSDTAPFTRTR